MIPAQGCYWHLGGQGQGSCSIPYRAQDSPHHSDPAPNGNRAEGMKPPHDGLPSPNTQARLPSWERVRGNRGDPYMKVRETETQANCLIQGHTVPSFLL